MNDWPTHWSSHSLGETGEYINGYAFKPEHRTAGRYPIIRIQNLTNPEAEANFTDFVPDARYIVKRGDILVSWSATLDAFIWDGGDALLNQHIFKVVPNHKLVRPKFLYYILRECIARLGKTSALHGSTMKHINRGPFLAFPVRLPSIPEQDTIVDTLDELLSDLDAGVVSLARARTKLRHYRASMLRSAAEGRLTLDWRSNNPLNETGQELLARILKVRREKWEADQLAKFSSQGKQPTANWRDKYEEPVAPDTKDLPELPVGWCWARAEQVCDFITKGTTPGKDKLFDGRGEIPFIKVYNLTSTGALDFSVKPTFVSKTTHINELARSKVLPGDVLMNIVGPPLGKISIVPDTYPEWNCNQAVAIFRPVVGLDRDYLATALMTDSILSWAVRRSKATAGQHNLTLEICRDLPIPLPPACEQVEIAARAWLILDSAEHLGNTFTVSTRRAATLRRALLKAAFEGKLTSEMYRDAEAEAVA